MMDLAHPELVALASPQQYDWEQDHRLAFPTGGDNDELVLVAPSAGASRASSRMTKKLLLAFAVVALAPEAQAQDAQCARERAAMVDTIRAHARADPGFAGSHGISARVLIALGETPRHRFIPDASCSIAYADRPVAIGAGQTISQPLIVAVMTDLAAVAADHAVLEIGTGSGYQAAILARLARKVCTVEIVPSLAASAADLLKKLGHDNVSVRAGDGYKGWPECGPFDSIVVTAALPHVPPPLIEQLKVGGRLVMPVGSTYGTQELTVMEKTGPQATKTRSVGLVRFVPFTRSRE
jgi:protein-L-isoaspartate(D-aspartate) O-methyltransferase